MKDFLMKFMKLPNIFLIIIIGIILVFILSNINTILDRFGLHSREAQIAEELAQTKAQLNALKDANTQLQKSLDETKAYYEAQLAQITQLQQQALETKKVTSSYQSNLTKKNKTSINKVKATTKAEGNIITIDKKEVDSVSLNNITTLNDAYTQFFIKENPKEKSK